MEHATRRFEGLTVLITGASRGIGRACAQRFASEGAFVVASARSMSALEQTVALAREAGGSAAAVPLDLRSDGAAEQLITAALALSPRIDVLVNAAGAWHGADESYTERSLMDTPVEQLREVLETGLMATMFVTRAVLPVMMQQRAGKVVSITCGFEGAGEARGWVHYYTSNQAIEALSRGLAAEVRPHNIQVNCVAPWYVDTEAVRRFFPAKASPALDPARVAELVALLASRASDHVSGQVIEARDARDF